MNDITVYYLGDGKFETSNDVELPPSEAFENMEDQSEMNEYSELVLRFWAEKGYDLPTCLQEYKNQIGEIK